MTRLSVLAGADRLVQTARWLRPVQIAGRLTARLRPVRVDLRPPPPPGRVAEPWSLPRWRSPAMLAPDRFRFLGQQHGLAGPQDWNHPGRERLWLYNLHYFDDLDAVPGPDAGLWRRALVRRWIAENPPPAGTGWEPYCLSLRIVNWIRAHWRGEALPPEAVASLAVQLRALESQLELRLLGNHLWANAKALAFGGLMFEGPEADGWLRLGARHLAAQLSEQVLADGGHFERSPMYHNIVAGDVLDLVQADRVAPGRLPRALAEALTLTAPRMIAWARTMTHPDGGPAFFNDSGFGVAPPTAVLTQHARALGLPDPAPPGALGWLQASGYVRAEAGPAVLIADVGEVGPDYLPGHAHADTLSFELSLGGRRVLVNTGVSTYEPGERRLWERGSAAHNTVVVDGEDSSQVWGGFRVARRARPLEASAAGNEGTVAIAGGHDGYRRLPGRVVHRRRWRLAADGLEIEDVLDGRPRRATACWHVHPDVPVRMEGPARAVLDLPGGETLSVSFEGGPARLVPELWAPQFGTVRPGCRIETALDGARLISRWRWPA